MVESSISRSALYLGLHKLHEAHPARHAPFTLPSGTLTLSVKYTENVGPLLSSSPFPRDECEHSTSTSIDRSLSLSTAV